MPGTISYRIIILDPETAAPEDLDGIGWGEMGRFQQNHSPGRSPECHRRTRTDPRL